MKRKIKLNHSAIFKTFIRKLLRQSDYSRWGKDTSLHPLWDERTEMIASLVPENSSIIEFGAGQMTLRKHLPKGCTYTPSDIVHRNISEYKSVIYDLNDSKPPELKQKYDIAVFSGVLEYVNDIPKLAKHLSPKVPHIIASYAITDYNPGLFFRRNSGWVNDYDGKSFVSLFEDAGYNCASSIRWKNQNIYYFKNNLESL